MTGTVAAIVSFLRGIHVKVSDDWADACIDWLQQEHQNAGETLTLDKIKKLVYEQWLVADLTELETCYLPPEVATAEKYSLSGPFCLQVNSMIDISTSYYSQQVKLKGIDTTNSSISFDEPKKTMWQPPHSRMFKLELTDGTITVHAMEYGTIPDLNSELKPGFKVLIKGKVLCRRGILMLKKENLQILGGEVDSLIEANTIPKVLAKAMEDCALHAGESARREFTAADAAQYADRINTAFKKKGQDLPGTHNTKTVTSGNSSRFTQGKNTSWNSKNPANNKTELWKPNLTNFADSSRQNNTDMDDFDNEWAADDIDDEFLDDALLAASQSSSSPKFPENSSNSLGQTPQHQQQNKKRSFSPYEVNDPSILPKTKTSRLSPLSTHESSARNSNEDFDVIFEDHWNNDEMAIAMEMDAELNKKFGDTAKKLNKNMIFPDDNENSSFAVSSSSSSSSSSRGFQLSTSTVRPCPQPNPTIKPNTNTQLKNPSITVNSNMDDIMQKWLELCRKKNTENLNVFSDLMKVEPPRLPFTYLFVFQRCQLPEDTCKFRVKGYVSTLLGKLERIDNKWKLMCMLNDGTGTLPVQLSDEVLTQLIGYSVQQSIEMTGANSDPNLKKKLQEGVKQCQLKIVNLSCIFEIEINKNYSHPLVTKITTINAGHIQQLRRQVTTALAKMLGAQN